MNLSDIAILPRATAEIANGAEYYGEGFIDIVHDRINELFNLVNTVKGLRPSVDAVNKTRLKKRMYPYHIYYGIMDNTLVIVSVFNYRQNPVQAPQSIENGFS